ncbi:class F sortase [Sporichthya sp.]|uniref:class F sortase n=1 Tax=Sporichthya sp. TaxID=65475 RepID=UPI0025D99885|nr:class F sortase [Sporichthya sp.]
MVARNRASRILTGLGLLILTGGVYTVTVGVAARAEAPRVEAPYVASAARPPADVVPPMIPPEALNRSLPVALSIPSLGVRSPVGEVGLGPDGQIEVPAVGPTYDHAAWYRYSPTPGERGPAVIEGHLDTPEGKPSVFYGLALLKPGDSVEVVRADTKTLTFLITEVARYSKAEFPTEAVYGDLDHPGLRLLTCGGSLDSAGDYQDNVVVFATLVAVSDPVESGTSERTGYRLHP